MTLKGYLDLDELILLCRNENARGFIEEAILCYRAGAYRQAIVATWIAVVYDIIYKYQELELTGDKNAKLHLENYENIRKSGDIRRSLQFEREILDFSKNEFELISDIEYVDLVRLQEDRNRCAHPAMNASDEIYQPTPELARTHLRNAIEHLLKRPPVQGKAALERLITSVESEYFPTNINEAIKYFSGGPLAHSKPALVSNFVIVLTKELLIKDFDPRKRTRLLCALKATLSIQRGFAQATLAGKLNDILMQLPDSELLAALMFLVDIEDTWQYLCENSIIRLKAFVRNLPREDEIVGLSNALKLSDLESEAVERLARVDYINLHNLVNCQHENVHPAIVAMAVDYYINSNNYDQANYIGSELIIPIAKSIPSGLIEPIIRASSENSQIRESYNMTKVLRCIRSCEIIPQEQFNFLLEKNRIDAIGSEDMTGEEWEVPNE